MTRFAALAALAAPLTLAAYHAAAARPDQYTGRLLVQGCDAFLAEKGLEIPLIAYRAGQCVGIVYALQGTMHAMGIICADPTLGDAVQVVAKYVKAHPAREDELFMELATDALHDKWPCRK